MQTHFPDQISISRDLELFPSCNYKWFLNRCLHLRKHVYNNDLEAGSEFASAMEVTRKAYFQQNVSEEEAIELGVANLLNEFGAIYEAAPFKDTLKTPEKMAEVFRRMFVENPMEHSSIVPFEMQDGTLSVEQVFEVELPFVHPETFQPLKLVGVLDLLGMRDNIIFGVDEKTCKSVLEKADEQLLMLKSSSQFVCYTCLANKNSEKFGGLNVTHFKVHKCKVKKSYASGENTVEGYEFIIDAWFQETWWNNMLYQVEDMLNKYLEFKRKRQIYTITKNDALLKEVVFPRAYGIPCTTFYRPCVYTYHCTSGNAQDLIAQGFSQVVSHERGVSVPLHDWRRHKLENVPLEQLVAEKEQLKQATADMSVDDFLDTFY